MEASLSAFENFLQTADAKLLKGSSPMLMELLTPIFHIFSDLLVKKLPSSSVFPSGPPTEDRSNVPTHEALGDAYQHIRDLEKQVALSEGKLQESQRCFDSVISSLASHIESTVPCVNDLRSSVENNTDTLASLPAIIAKPSYAQVASLPAAVSSFTIPLPPSEKVLLVRQKPELKNINNGGIAICLTINEDVSKLSQELSNNADFASFSISKPIRRLRGGRGPCGSDILLIQDPYINYSKPLNPPRGSTQFFSLDNRCLTICFNRSRAAKLSYSEGSYNPSAQSACSEHFRMSLMEHKNTLLCCSFARCSHSESENVKTNVKMTMPVFFVEMRETSRTASTIIEPEILSHS
ncbi:hypothetical protein TNIN_193361 [Trichonephila inaurata madagascariensis]|uniref:Uncharacterized protein n=1 Tax=Trichonephila inaurata madagascariensis TaxID=2747483 RepID=A0A8X7CM72_9ARAC|nr:hypothetical protein TNIN_193361 [Trichonephila inaurata madagascariensis]